MSRVIAAIDVGGTSIAGALVVYDGVDSPPVAVHHAKTGTDAYRGGDAVMASIVSFANDLVAGAKKEGLPSVAGIGIGSAGVIDPRSGNVRYANEIMPGWSGQRLRDHLELAVGLPVAAMGDVHAHALGEARWGAARGASSCLCVGVGTGVGGAYVLDGHVVQGFRGAAGHLGHTLHPAATGVACACGSQSHVETVCSGTALSARYQGKGIMDPLDPSLMGDTIAARANAGELEAIEVMEFAGRSLGEAIGSWCNLLDPELVVLSGSVTAAGALWRRALDEGFKSQVMKPLAETPIVYAGLGADAPLIGAAENFIDQYGKTSE